MALSNSTITIHISGFNNLVVNVNYELRLNTFLNYSIVIDVQVNDNLVVEMILIVTDLR